MATNVDNFTHLPHLRFSNLNREGNLFGVLMVKGAFDVGLDGACSLADEQEPFNFSDAYHGAMNTTSLRHPSDLVPYKPSTDIIVDAVSFAPNGGKQGSWQAAIAVQDLHEQNVSKTLRLWGPRSWLPSYRLPEALVAKLSEARQRDVLVGWVLSEPEPVASIPIRYELAYGGMIERVKDGEPAQVEAYEYNPVGQGWIDDEWTRLDRPVPAPQLEDPEVPIASPGIRYAPQGFGAIPPAWLPRRPLGGTYDQHWIDHIWPNWAPDYDFRFHHSAHPDLISAAPLDGDLTVTATNLRPEPGFRDWTFRLACPRLFMTVSTRAGASTAVRPQLDTIFLDLSADRLDQCSVQCTWRLVFDPLDTTNVAIDVWPLDQAASMRERLAAPPHPDSVARFDPRFQEAEA